MPPTHSATPGLRRAEPSAPARQVRATSPTKSRLTIRLPDLSTPRGATNDASATTDLTDKIHVASATGVAAEVKPSSVAAIGEAASSLAQRLPDMNALPQKVIAFMRQPKFWLACITAIAVQILLAAVMTPAEDAVESNRPRTAAKPWPKPTPAPAARIVVPAAPAPTDVLDGPLHGATTPMGLTVPLDSSSDSAAPSGDAPARADGTSESSPRTADRRRWAEEGGQLDGRAVGEPDGATLGGIMPLEPNPESITNEQP